jgi:CRISPR-associated protein Cmr2
LAQTVLDEDWSTKAKEVYREEIALPPSGEHSYTAYVGRVTESYARLGFATPRLDGRDLLHLPSHSFFLYVPFRLASPYISTDDAPLYVHENPVRKDHVIRVPIVSSTSWKGAFRAALRWRLEVDDADEEVVRLMGNTKGAGEGFRRGRLSFYPTFFDALEVGMINPHYRKSGAGWQPIHIEQVPRGAGGAFALLHTPIVPDTPKEALPSWEDVLHDLDLVGQACYTMLAELGFGAKTGSGMGRVAAEIPDAYLRINVKDRQVLRLKLKRLRFLNELRHYVEGAIKDE